MENFIIVPHGLIGTLTISRCYRCDLASPGTGSGVVELNKRG